MKDNNPKHGTQKKLSKCPHPLQDPNPGGRWLTVKGPRHVQEQEIQRLSHFPHKTATLKSYQKG